jgi:hypothetical protein
MIISLAIGVGFAIYMAYSFESFLGSIRDRFNDGEYQILPIRAKKQDDTNTPFKRQA